MGTVSADIAKPSNSITATVTPQRNEVGADFPGTLLVGVPGPQGEKGDTGPQGPQGEKGDTGAAGAAGKTPVKGTDYYTEADKTEMVNLVLAALPTWTGGSY